MRRIILIVLLMLVILSVYTGCTNQKNDYDNNKENNNEVNMENIKDLAVLLPNEKDYTWKYYGFAEYGHIMKLEEIRQEKESILYIVSGNVYDTSGEASTDFNFSVTYTVMPDVLIQDKIEEAMMDSEFNHIELIRTPLTEGSSWNQEVKYKDGKETILKCTITNIENIEGNKSYTVTYEDTVSDYYEKRIISEGIGVVLFEKLYINKEGNFSIGYQLYYEDKYIYTTEEINQYLPPLNKELYYYGLAEYGHIGVLKEISSDDKQSIYEYYGTYNDGTGIPDEFVSKYIIDYTAGIVTETVLSNTRNDKMEVNSRLYNLVILKLPVKKGTVWYDDVVINGNPYIVKAEIVEFNSQINGRIKVKYTVSGVPGYYNEIYIEERVFEKEYGMTSFTNIMPGDIGINEEDKKDLEKVNQAIMNHSFGYSLNKW